MSGEHDNGERDILEGREGEFENIIPESQEFVKETFRQAENPDFRGTNYGHSLVVLASELRTEAMLFNPSPEEQLENLREEVKKLIDEFGPRIITVLRDELKMALTEEDVQSLTVNSNS